jgi:hypothetical protein
LSAIGWPLKQYEPTWTREPLEQNHAQSWRYLKYQAEAARLNANY